MKYSRFNVLYVAAVLLLVSCYAPDNFRAELRLSRYGDYVLSFDGELIYLPIQHDYAQNLITPEEDAQRQEDIRQDLARDPAFSRIVPMGRGRFRVKYLGPILNGKIGGRLGSDELVSIIRRDAHMLMLKSHPNNQIVIAAGTLEPSDIAAMAKVGLGMTGEFRLVTDGNVVENDASEVRPDGAYQVYIWKIYSPATPMPHVVMIRDFDPSRPEK